MIFPIPLSKYKILKIIYKKQKVSISELIRDSHCSPRIAYQYVNSFLHAGVINEKLTGKKPLSRFFTPNLSREEGILCFALIESEDALEFLLKHPKLKGPISHFSREIQHIADTALIFGSFARGSQSSTSDIDIFVIGEKINKERVADIAEKCFVTIANKPSIRIFNTKAFIDLFIKNDDFAMQILKDHIILINFIKWVEIIRGSHKFTD